MIDDAWTEKAACKGLSVLIFVPESAGNCGYDTPKAICRTCPVRYECCEAAIREEAGTPIELRCGIRGGTTGPQRAALEAAGGLRGADPMALCEGYDTARSCAVPAIPTSGHNWSRHHTTLSHKLIRWLVDNVPVGGQLPPQSHVMAALSCTATPLRRVLDALVADGTLDVIGKREHSPGDNAATRKLVRAGTPGVVSAWLPVHLRNTAF